ncbi:MAG TPA: penicillin-binding protein 2 [Pyrinomonadaceae bacterium]|jgi:penicillin-binding protein 2
MKFEDDSQNLRARLRVIQGLVLLLLAVLAIRLYVLQVVNGRRYAERAENQRIRLLPIPAPRGVIFDRNGNVLVNSRPIYNVIVSREDIKGKDFGAMVKPLSEGLMIDPDALRERFEQVKSQPAFESILIKENVTQADISWVEAHTLEQPELRVEQQPQRLYPANGMLAHVLGYVGEISPEQLELPRYKEKGYKPGDIIGQEGLEAVYDDYLRGRDGYRRVVVDSRGHVQSVLEVVQPQPGQDMVTTIDLTLQETAEEQLRNSTSKRGVIVAMDPNNGEILAMASAPTYDPNLFSQRITTKEGRREYAALLNDPKTPLYNRAVQGRYPPGSTWKIPMSVAGLQQGAITVEHSNLVCGGGITIGNKFTRCMNSHGSPPLDYAITHSCDAYYYRLGLKMGVDGMMKMVDDFELNKRTGVDLPHELISWTPNYWKPKLEERGEQWKDIRTVYASIGQDTVAITPLSSLRAVAAIGVGGKMYVPHLAKEFREVSAIGEPDSPDYRPLRPSRGFDRPEPKIIPISKENHDLVVKGMWGVVNGSGTAARIRMAGFEIAGKTGTAQVVGLGKDTGENKDHAWFVSYAPAYKPEIAAIALIENVGFGGTHAAPAVRALYDVYYRKTRHEEPPGSQQIALNKR